MCKRIKLKKLKEELERIKDENKKLRNFLNKIKAML